MKIQIPTTNYVALRKQIRDYAESDDWQAWSVIWVKMKYGGKVRRLVHTPKGDDQYKDVQLKLCDPIEADRKQGKLYLDIMPVKAKDSELTEDQLHEKSAIVLGRLSEMLNRYFPLLKGYKVILK